MCEMSGPSISATHRFLCVYHMLTGITLALLSGLWHETTYGITFLGKRKSGFRVLLATMSIEFAFSIYHLVKVRQGGFEQRSVDVISNRTRTFFVHVAMAIMSLICNFSNGGDDSLLLVLQVAVWLWRNEVYDAYGNGNDNTSRRLDTGEEVDTRTKLGTTVFALAVPTALFFGNVDEVSTYRILAFVVLVSYVFLDSISQARAWAYGYNQELMNFFIDIVATATFMVNSIVLVDSTHD